ncbi:MAG: hypothetical protein E7Z65_04810 [Thermoplasmata archaeon]|nr:hypothetical protein [Thermoplasmata archaeon]
MARAISDKGSNTIHVNQEGLSISDMFRVSSTTMLSMMIAIIILIVVPNNLGIWEHIVVMILALLGLFYYNRKTIQKMFEAQVTSVDSDSNQHLDGAANTSDEHQDQNRSEVVSINLNDRKLE